MAAWRCANADCGAAAAPGWEWRKGWGLRSGGFANLCDKCGMAYEQSVYCELFHQKESGWRQCTFCDKRVHCGCIASKPLIDLLDSGGVQCFSCMKNAEPSMVSGKVIDFLPQPPRTVIALSARSPKDKRSNDFRTSLTGNACELGSTSADCKVDVNAVAMSKVVQLGKSIDGNGHTSFFPAKRDNYSLSGPLGHIKEEHIALLGSAPKDGIICSPAGQPCINMSSGNTNLGPMLEAVPNSAIPHMTLPLSSTFEEGRDHNTMLSALQQAQRARHVLAKPPKASHCASSDSSKEFVSNLRVARPPGEGRGRNQLLPRYWPRITDQELQQISGDSNSTIVPLFEKVLSASDAGRIGRLVLPKACAEAYFPSISQPEGLPLKIQDVRGKEWQFQFRFWPNNNSRMYVLEGVTPCIQSLQLQAGDTVTFSRIDPEGKLVMGFRKATNSVPLQDSQISAIANGALGSEAFFSAVNESIPIVSGYSGLVQTFKGTVDPNLSCLPEHFNLADEDISWEKTDKHGGIMLQPLLVAEKRRNRNIGSKSKRLHMDDEDALELKLSWEEAQELLRPPPSVKPSIVMIEDHEFEEYEEPPVLGKRTIFTSRESGSLDQWIQCDECYKWRRLPVDVLPPPKWTCSDNKMDPQRSSCSVSDELSPKELQTLLRQNADLKRWKAATSSSQNNQYVEASGLDALATVATLGEQENQTMPSMATTTKHPRHRSGCSCIVCIQPPSGKGPKHSPNCECIVCLTVKRRFKTLMMRKKQRQSERGEGEAALKKIAWSSNEDNEANSSLKNPPSLDYRTVTESLDSKGHIDLNFHPERDAAQRAGQLSRMSMMNLLQIANSPLETYLKQNGLTSLAGETQVSSSSLTVPHAPGDSEGRTPEESCFASSAQEREVGTDEGCCGSDKAKNDPA